MTRRRPTALIGLAGSPAVSSFGDAKPAETPARRIVLGQFTSNELEVLRIVARFHHEHQYGPTIRELAERFEKSLSNTARYVTNLRERGALIGAPVGIQRKIAARSLHVAPNLVDAVLPAHPPEVK